jgi:hypothetical protein
VPPVAEIVTVVVPLTVALAFGIRDAHHEALA